MRIDIVCASREVFGSDRSAVRLAGLLEEAGHDTALRVPMHRPERGLSGLAHRRGIPVDEAPVPVVSSRGLTGLDASSLTASGSDAEAVIYNSAAILPHRSRNIPSALVLREWLSADSWRHRAISALHRRHADAVVAVSTGVGDRWRECGGGRTPARVIWNWLEDSWLHSPRSSGEREGIVFAGRLNGWKGQMTLADAYDRAFGGMTNRPSLTFIGAEGKSSPFHPYAQSLERRCQRSGWRLLPQHSSLHRVFRRAALVVVPSMRPEPFGNVILEALASGCRVMAFPGGGPDDMAPLFPEALELAPRDTTALSNSLRRWWHSGGQAQSDQVHTRSRAILHDLFSAHAARDSWQEVIQGIASSRKADELDATATVPRIRRLRATRQLERTT